MTVTYCMHLVQTPGVAPYYNITNDEGFVVMAVNSGTKAFEAFMRGIAAMPDVVLEQPGSTVLTTGSGSGVVLINPSDSVCMTGGVMLDPWHQINVVSGRISGDQYPMTAEDKATHVKRMKAKPVHHI